MNDEVVKVNDEVEGSVDPSYEVEGSVDPSYEDYRANDEPKLIEKPEEPEPIQEDIEEEAEEILFRTKNKGIVYLYDSEGIVYELLESNEKGNRVGYRKLNKKTDKHKIVFD